MMISSEIGKSVSVYNNIKISIFTIILIIHVGTDLLNFLIPKTNMMLLSDAFECSPINIKLLNNKTVVLLHDY